MLIESGRGALGYYQENERSAGKTVSGHNKQTAKNRFFREHQCSTVQCHPDNPFAG